MSAAWTDDADTQAGRRLTSDPVTLRIVQQTETLIVIAFLLAAMLILGVAAALGQHLPCERLTAQHQPQADRVCAVQR